MVKEGWVWQRLVLITHFFYAYPSYQVVKKTGSKSKLHWDDLIDYIKTYQRGTTGIIYCQSRKHCEYLASKLVENGIKSKPYHAKVCNSTRLKIQQQWQLGEFQVMVATIAFGMGIDKANVRYVIHEAMPASLEGFYQETGRAGRDGQPATCRLYYHYSDAQTQRIISETGSTSSSAISSREQAHQLHSMVAYCEDHLRCRKVILMEYFGEYLDPNLCQNRCDYCSSQTSMTAPTTHVFTPQEIRSVINLVDGLAGYKFTLLQLLECCRGSKSKAITEKLPTDSFSFGSLSHLDKSTVEKLLIHLVVNNVLKEEVSGKRYARVYVKVSSEKP